MVDFVPAVEDDTSVEASGASRRPPAVDAAPPAGAEDGGTSPGGGSVGPIAPPPVLDGDAPPVPRCIVGIGASAGGLAAVTALVRTLDPAQPCAYVLLQHLAPEHRSRMVPILARETALGVQPAHDGVQPRPGVLYVVPADCDATLRDGRLCLAPGDSVAPRPSINRFFTSLAERMHDGAVGIVLSGTGADGTAGLRAIQAAGGITIAQEPTTAAYAGMPRAAIDAGVAEHVLAPDAIAGTLSMLVRALGAIGTAVPPAESLQALLQLLRTRLKVDFTGYRMSTLVRRIRRRAAMASCPDVPSYVLLAESDAEELGRLARDMLISVTRFFRDPDAYAELRAALALMLAGRGADAPVRAWVAGCATGEEAYSIAIELCELLGIDAARGRVQVFATDIDVQALQVARRGVYPLAALADVPPAYLEHHFVRSDSTMEVAPHLRDMVLFARHDLASDPPFLRLDLVSCRNVLIYFDAPLQARVLQSIAFGMNPGALLMLGRAETITHASRPFAPLSRRQRLFRRRDDAVAVAARVAGPTDAVASGPAPAALPATTSDPVAERPQPPPDASAASKNAGRGFATTAAAVTAPVGDPTAAPAPAVSATSGNAVRSTPAPASDAGDAAPPSADARSPLAQAHARIAELEGQLQSLGQQLQQTTEQAQAAGEELQATNEELESANEELQASNEELVSLNDEMQRKGAELGTLAGEYAHLYNALTFPVLVFDRHLNLVRFNQSATHRLDLHAIALRRHVDGLNLDRHLPGMRAMLERALHQRDRVEQSITVPDGAASRTLLITATPSADGTGQVTNVVICALDVSDVVRARENLRQSQLRMSMLMEHTQVLFAMRDPHGNYLYVNPRWIQVFGLPPAAEVIGKSDFALLPRELARALWLADMQALREGTTVTSEHRLQVANTVRWVQLQHHAQVDTDGSPTSFFIEGEDVSSARLAEEQLRVSARVFDQAGDAIVVCDPRGVVQAANAAFLQRSGYQLDELVGSHHRLFVDARHGAEFVRRVQATLREAHIWQGELWSRHKRGEPFASWTTVTRTDGPDGRPEHFIAVFSSMERARGTRVKSDFLATHDALTGLPNRELFQDRLRQALAHARRSGQKAAVMFVDLDNFKQVNDSLGHEAGDELLKELATRLRQAVRDVDTVARQGGDEFIIILSECTTDSAEHVARRVVEALSGPVTLGTRQVTPSASVGVALFPDDGEDSADLIRAADSAMYSAKDLGRDRVVFFKPALQAKLMRHAAVEDALREALREHRLRLAFQPKFALSRPHGDPAASGHGLLLVGAEALVRWTDPHLGEMTPSEFIAVAEGSTLINAVTAEVQRLLFEQMAAWRDFGLPLVRIAMNVSPRSIREAEFAARMLAQVSAHGLQCAYLVLEITEGALLETSPVVTENIRQIADCGMALAIDDFGTGYSSLGYLKRLPISELKIDKSFVDGLGRSREDEAIARAVLGLAGALNLRTVAEGVETDLQRQWLLEHGCELAQGYLLGRPMPAERFATLLAAHARHAAA